MPPNDKQTWRTVSETEFRAWLDLRAELLPRPPLTTKNVNHREWSDPSLAHWPENVLGKMTRRPRGKGACYQIRLVREP